MRVGSADEFRGQFACRIRADRQEMWERLGSGDRRVVSVHTRGGCKYESWNGPLFRKFKKSRGADNVHLLIGERWAHPGKSSKRFTLQSELPKARSVYPPIRAIR